MKVSTGCNPYSYQQQRSNAQYKGKNFADMYAEMSVRKSCEAGERTHADIVALNLMPRGLRGFRSRAGLRMVTEDDAFNMLEFGRLEKYEAEELPELIESKSPEPKYPKSIWDIPPSELEAEITAARTACSYIDTEGLTKGEIYNRIESTFKDYLGEDFETQWDIYACVMNGGGPGTQGHGFFLAQSEFESQLIRFDVGRGNVEILKEARGYTGMSKDEMRAAVRGKYPEVMTLKECILMARELRKLGLEEINYGNAVTDRIFSTLGIDPGQRNSKIQKLYDALLDLPASFETMKTSYDAFEKNGYRSYPTYNMDNVFKKMLSWFGGGELSGAGTLSKLRRLLDEMKNSGELTFDKYGYCASAKNFRAR